MKTEIRAIEHHQAGELVDLYHDAWWSSGRSLDEVERMLERSSLVVVVTAEETGELLGSARVLTDGVYVALIVDVVVKKKARGSGLGADLMTFLLEHPVLAGVRSVELVCQPGLIAFYEKFGFTDAVGGSRLMRRTSAPELLGERDG